jgi:hypothetical protein
MVWPCPTFLDLTLLTYLHKVPHTALITKELVNLCNKIFVYLPKPQGPNTYLLLVTFVVVVVLLLKAPPIAATLLN